VLTEEMNELDPRAEPEFFINGEKWPTVTPIDVPLGATELWEVKNDAEMDHPFHLHGVFFQVIERNGVLEAPVGNKDTVIVPKHSSLRFAVRFDAEGPWMYHCHILEHAERGMMGHVMVGAP
jgi:FtsP/CotA-like multicopper oxidase with cupredoxin domain